jgi:serine/threonine protein kinase
MDEAASPSQWSVVDEDDDEHGKTVLRKNSHLRDGSRLSSPIPSLPSFSLLPEVASPTLPARKVSLAGNLNAAAAPPTSAKRLRKAIPLDETPPPDSAVKKPRADQDSPNSTGSATLFRFTSFPASLPRIHHNNSWSSSSSTDSGNDDDNVPDHVKTRLEFPTLDESAPRTLFSSRLTSVSRPPRSSRRPLPDNGAFDGTPWSNTTATTLLCPPTPMRTPAWAQDDVRGGGKFRANSLVVTKVLATCSPQVLDGRTSLENSLALADDDDDDDKSEVDTVIEENQEDDADDDQAAASNLPPAAAAPVSLARSFVVLELLGRGVFADVYRVQSRETGHLFAVKRHRRPFRGQRDRERALAEVRAMQRLQSAYANAKTTNPQYGLHLLFFYQAWQEDGHFLCQTELCCRDTCHELLQSLRSEWPTARTRYPSVAALPPPPSGHGRYFPAATLYKICHDVAAGLSHIHAHGLTHQDLKPSNLFLSHHGRLGAMIKIGDFGLAGDIGSPEDAEEGDPKYMAPELLSAARRHPSADVYSLGMTLYEMACDLAYVIPTEGQSWHELRSPQHVWRLEHCDDDLCALIRSLLHVEPTRRPTVAAILQNSAVSEAGQCCNEFLRDYLRDIEAWDQRQQAAVVVEEQTPTTRVVVLTSPPGLASLRPPIHAPAVAAGPPAKVAASL